MEYSCPGGCGRSFSNERKLSNHQPRCTEYKESMLRLSTAAAAKRAREAGLVDVRQEKRQRVSDIEDVRAEPMEVDVPDNVPPIPEASGSSSPPPSPPPPAIEPPKTFSVRSGRPVRFPRHFDDFMPSQRRNPLAHIPDKPPPVRHVPRAPRVTFPSRSPSPDLPRPKFETTPDDFGLYRVYARLPTSHPDAGTRLSDLSDIPTTRQPLPTSEGSSSSPETPPDDQPDDPKYYAPFSNPTAAWMFVWQNTGSNIKSHTEMDRLALGLASGPPIDQADLGAYRTSTEERNLDAYIKALGDDAAPSLRGWQSTSIKIPLPAEKVKCPEGQAPVLEVNGLVHRKIVDIITGVFSDPVASTFHFTPFEQLWKPTPEAEPQGVYGEAYCSEMMRELQDQVDALPLDDGEEDLERVVAGLQFASDSTHLASFGPAEVWPIYLQVGNQSKYTRGRPSADAWHHVAYIPKIPNDVQDTYNEHFGKNASDDTLTHLKRELIHGIWETLTDAEFVHAYHHGIVVTCSDGIRRRIFPRFFTYAADYPEKMLLAGLKFLAKCPCPRCFVEKDKVHKVGTQADMHVRAAVRVDDETRRRNIESARGLIFNHGIRIGADRVKVFLPGSMTPTRNAFSKFAPHGLNFHEILVIDQLHEVELGFVKSTITHNIRICYANGNNAIQKLDQRYRLTPLFGRDTIRRFSSNASSLKKLAGRDFEDLLQCALPAFEGLLESAEDNKIMLDLLFDLATFHAHAKLRMHTDSTLDDFDLAVVILGKGFRKYKKMCSNYNTVELPREEAARGRRNAALAAKKASAGTVAPTASEVQAPAIDAQLPAPNTQAPAVDIQAPAGDTQASINNAQVPRGEPSTPAAGGQAPAALAAGADAAGSEAQAIVAQDQGAQGDANTGGATTTTRKTASGKNRKGFNINTAKVHTIGDYPNSIRARGTTDSYSTQLSECEHRISKRRYARTSKSNFVPQLAKHETRKRLLAHVHESIRKRMKVTKVKATRKQASSGLRDEPLPFNDPSARYQMALSTRNPLNLTTWLGDHLEDPALQNFEPRLKAHLLARLLNRQYDGDEHEFSDEELDTVILRSNTLYQHATVRINYTTYDVRRSQDTINPKTRPNVMVLSHEDDADSDDPAHPFWYARVLRVFHVVVTHRGPLSTSEEPKRMDVLWIRWFGLNTEPDARGGWAKKRLHSVSFIPEDEPGAFGFLDPAVVVRGCHIIPSFMRGRTSLRLSPSIARLPEEKDEDYESYYVNMFVDRDMFMRFLGGGVGHRATRYCDLILQKDRPSGAEDDDGGVDVDTEDDEDDEQGDEDEELAAYWDSDDEGVGGDDEEEGEFDEDVTRDEELRDLAEVADL